MGDQLQVFWDARWRGTKEQEEKVDLLVRFALLQYRLPGIFSHVFRWLLKREAWLKASPLPPNHRPPVTGHRLCSLVSFFFSSPWQGLASVSSLFVVSEGASPCYPCHSEKGSLCPSEIPESQAILQVALWKRVTSGLRACFPGWPAPQKSTESPPVFLPLSAFHPLASQVAATTDVPRRKPKC